MELQAWADEGVDLSALVSETFLWEEDDLVVHGLQHCSLLQSRQVRVFSAPLSTDLEAEFCPECWDRNLSDEAGELVNAVLDMDDMEWRLAYARKDPLGKGFSYLVACQRRMPQHPGVSSWRRRVESTMTGLLQQGAREAGVTLGPQGRGVLLLEESMLSAMSLTRLVSAGWVRECRKGLVFRVPEELYHRVSMMLRFEWHPEEKGWSGALLPEEGGETVLETALALLDPHSPVLWSIEHAVTAAQMV